MSDYKSFYCPGEVRNQLRKLSKKMEINQSEVIRVAVRELFLKKQLDEKPVYLLSEEEKQKKLNELYAEIGISRQDEDNEKFGGV